MALAIITIEDSDESTGQVNINFKKIVKPGEENKDTCATVIQNYLQIVMDDYFERLAEKMKHHAAHGGESTCLH